MISCPKCKKDIPGEWSETKNGKNWIKLHNGNWHSCEGNKDNQGYYEPEYTRSVYVCHSCGSPTDFQCPKCGNINIIDVK